MGEIQRHLEAGAHFIYRHKTGTIYRDVQSDEPLDLPRLLRRHGSLDLEVALNDAPRTRVRLVAAPVSQQTASQRLQLADKILALMVWWHRLLQ